MMIMMTNFFMDEDEEMDLTDDNCESEQGNKAPWMIVYDEMEIHQITKRVLRNFEFEKKGLIFFNAYSGYQLSIIINTLITSMLKAYRFI
jgi:hypothetical protein